jgi:hypothetical protein
MDHLREAREQTSSAASKLRPNIDIKITELDSIEDRKNILDTNNDRKTENDQIPGPATEREELDNDSGDDLTDGVTSGGIFTKSKKPKKSCKPPKARLYKDPKVMRHIGFKEAACANGYDENG